jgi:hypothetical protein
MDDGRVVEHEHVVVLPVVDLSRFERLLEVAHHHPREVIEWRHCHRIEPQLTVWTTRRRAPNPRPIANEKYTMANGLSVLCGQGIGRHVHEVRADGRRAVGGEDHEVRRNLHVRAIGVER